MPDIFNTFLLAIIGGIIPPVIWLWFWLKEDSNKPEPKKLIIRTFISGFIMIPFALLIQVFISSILIKTPDLQSEIATGSLSALLSILLWAAAEEFFKFIAAFRSGLSSKANDEPIDPMIYMITAALGFSAGENILYLLTPLLQADYSTALLTGNFRFIGAVLVHVACSATIGVGMALAFGKAKRILGTATFTSFILAVALHAFFNFLIIYSDKAAYAGLALVWMAVISIILIFERVKRIRIGNFK